MGKGMQPKKNYNHKKWYENFDNIDWSKSNENKTKDNKEKNK
jgi:hypothetical protein